MRDERKEGVVWISVRRRLADLMHPGREGAESVVMVVGRRFTEEPGSATIYLQ